MLENEDKKKILVVDDSLPIAKLVARVIDRMGHNAIVCHNGMEALKLMDDNPDIALVVTDVVMPEMDGKELVAALRKMERLKDLPIIIMSAIVRFDDVQTFINLGATYFLEKPINDKVLNDYIYKSLKQSMRLRKVSPED